MSSTLRAKNLQKLKDRAKAVGFSFRTAQRIHPQNRDWRINGYELQGRFFDLPWPWVAFAETQRDIGIILSKIEEQKNAQP